MTAQEIILLISDNSEIENLNIETNIVLDFSKIQSSPEKIEFINCQFQGNFLFINLISLDGVVIFKDCKFPNHKALFPQASASLWLVLYYFPKMRIPKSID